MFVALEASLGLSTDSGGEQRHVRRVAVTGDLPFCLSEFALAGTRAGGRLAWWAAERRGHGASAAISASVKERSVPVLVLKSGADSVWPRFW
jgi:hypothetical protein